MKINIPCCSKGGEDDNDVVASLPVDEDYEIEEDYQIANYKTENVKNEYTDIFHAAELTKFNLLWSAIKPRTFKSAIIGVTWKPVLLFLILYYLFQILYQYEFFSTCTKLEHDVVEPEADAALCNRVWHDWVSGN